MSGSDGRCVLYADWTILAMDRKTLFGRWPRRVCHSSHSGRNPSDGEIVTRMADAVEQLSASIARVAKMIPPQGKLREAISNGGGGTHGTRVQIDFCPLPSARSNGRTDRKVSNKGRWRSALLLMCARLPAPTRLNGLPATQPQRSVQCRQDNRPASGAPMRSSSSPSRRQED